MIHKRPVVVGLGEILWDILPGKKRIGGAPANFALHSRSLGAEAKICSSTGDDELGKEIKNKLTKINSIAEYIFTGSRPTGVVDVQIDENGSAKYTIKENAAWDFITWNSKIRELAQKCDAVCFGTLAQRNSVSRETISQFLQNTGPGCLKVFDVNLRQNYYSKKIIQDSLKIADIVKLNESEIETLRQMFEIEGTDRETLSYLAETYNLDLIALTMGKNGSLMIAGDDESYYPAFPVKVKDTVGAGDAFTATMTIGKYKNLNLKKINMLSSKIAAFVCTREGATPQLPENLINEFKNEKIKPVKQIDPKKETISRASNQFIQ